jgi:outer membrane protein OmpA-like peptidoglycan-associated protein
LRPKERSHRITQFRDQAPACADCKHNSAGKQHRLKILKEHNMKSIFTQPTAMVALAAIAISAPANVFAQELSSDESEVLTTVTGSVPSDLEGLAEGPEVDGIISARNDGQILIAGPAGNTTVSLSNGTEIRARKGLFGINRQQLGQDSLLNGLPVKVKTVRWNDRLVATRVTFSDDDLETANMIRGGTQQQFAQQGAAIDQNAAATEALRGRFGDIDQYNLKGTTNVYFDTGKWNLSAGARAELCEAASQADGMDNALLLVVGYTDSTGSYEINQELSEKRASRVVNYLQQQCGWKPYRMLTPTGMADSDPAADNSTPYGKSQNRRVAVNILVSKSVDGF